MCQTSLNPKKNWIPNSQLELHSSPGSHFVLIMACTFARCLSSTQHDSMQPVSPTADTVSQLHQMLTDFQNSFTNSVANLQ